MKLHAKTHNVRVSGGPLGTRADYESDVRAAEEAYAANKSSMNHEDLFAARAALRRHWPNARMMTVRMEENLSSLDSF